MNLILSGFNGRMGKIITKCVSDEHKDINIVAGVSRSGNKNNNNEYKVDVFKSFEEILHRTVNDKIHNADCIIDFSNPNSLTDILNFAIKNHVSLVIATTGYSNEQILEIKNASQKIPIFFASNYSIGITLLIKHAKEIVKTFGEGADIEILEIHHNKKADSPSGTALTIAKEIQDVCHGYKIKSGRCGLEPRKKNEIGISSMRMGNIRGIHEVNICNKEECLTLRHEAFSRKIFANGAITAAKFVYKKAAGLYNVKDMIK